MAKDDESDAPVFDADAAPRWAADEPTAMWDDSIMRESGYEALVEDRSKNPRGESGPATQKGYGGASSSRVEVSADATGGHRAAAPPQKKGGGVSWAATIALALTLAVIVFFVVRALR